MLCLPCLILTACGPQGEPKGPVQPQPESESGVVAPMEEFNFIHLGTSYVIRLEATMFGVAGDVVVMGFDPTSTEAAPARLGEVARAVCEAEGRQFDKRPLVRRAHEDSVWTFVGACL